MIIMGALKKYYLLIAVILIIIVLVFIRSFVSLHFDPEAKKWYASSATRANIITESEAQYLPGTKLIISFDKPGIFPDHKYAKTIYISADNILERKNIEAIRSNEGPVLLTSSAIPVAARTWMLLSQLGLKNIYILTNDTENEVPKYKFRPDTSVSPEQ